MIFNNIFLFYLYRYLDSKYRTYYNDTIEKKTHSNTADVVQSMLLVSRQNSNYLKIFLSLDSLSFFFWKGESHVKISQILNNNVAVVKRGSNEAIIYAKGVAFKKKVGQTILENEIEKTYVLDSNDMLEHFSYLLSNSDAEQISFVNDLITYGVQKERQNIILFKIHIC